MEEFKRLNERREKDLRERIVLLENKNKELIKEMDD